jgi:predicted nucleic acid-binding Zn ribbon protein
MACLVCRAPLERPEMGRPPSYCSTGCRRAAEYELRRLQRRLQVLEDQAARERILGNAVLAGRVESEVKRAELRLL